MRLMLLFSLFVLVSACGAQQKLGNSFMVSPGMTKSQVVTTMGDTPVASQFEGALEEWHYCNTGKNGVSTYVAIYFESGRVLAMKPYSVVEKHEGGNAFAVCEEFIKKGNYNEPEIVSEYRVKFR